MDQKAWLWKKRSTEKTLVADKANKSLSKNEEELNEVEKLLAEKTDLERDVRILNEKLSSALSGCNSKDNIVKKQVKIAEEAIAGWEKAETDAVTLKQELDRVLQQKASSDERIGHLDAALKECMQQLRFVREEQEKRIHDAVAKTSEQFQKIKVALNEKLEEAGKRMTKLDAENTQLSKALSGKDKVIEDLSKYKAQFEVDFNSLMTRVESTEKENASLKYEIRVLEKELDIRNEEREFNRRTAYVSQKQHQDSAKRIAQLETECQRLRILVRKRLPGPGAMAKMRSEAEMLRNDQIEIRRVEVAPDAPGERINLLTEQLCTMEEENKALKVALNKKSHELQSPRTVYARTSSRLSRAERQEHSVAASSDVGSDDKASCAESWASALISELEHFKNEKQLGTPAHKSMGNSDINLMDDFAEMEKLAVDSVDYLSGSYHLSSEEQNAIVGNSGSLSGGHSPSAPGRELSLDASDTRSENNISNTKKSAQKSHSNMLTSIQKVLELLEGINIQSPDSGLSESVSGKDNNHLSHYNLENPTGLMVRVFQWKTAELSSILQKFIGTCSDLLNGTADLEQFAQEVSSNLEWIMNRCFSIQDVSSMKNAIRNNLDWDDSGSESEEDSRWHSQRQDMTYFPIKEEDITTRNSEPENKESSVVDLEDRLLSEIVKTECFKVQLQESKDIIENLHSEMETMKQSKGETKSQDEKQKMMKEDLETQLMETNTQWTKACQRTSHLENELENKNIYSKRLEQTCHDLNAQLKSLTNKGNTDQNLLQNDMEINAASEKLAECQETILNLGKQLKALASPGETAHFDAVSTPVVPRRSVSQRSSLLDKMLAEDKDKLAASQTKKDIQNGNGLSAVSTNGAMEYWDKSTNANGTNHEEESKTAATWMDIVPLKKKGGRSFFRKLFWRRKKSNNYKKTSS